MRKKCPRCGSYLDEDLKVCLDCGYSKKKRKTNSLECPHCGQRLVHGYCRSCDWKRGEDNFLLVILAIIIIALIFFF